jgi:hypothetical protein
MLVIGLFVAVAHLMAQSDTSDPAELQRQIDQLHLKSSQANDEAKNLDQSAANEDKLAQTGPTWARAVHQVAAATFRNRATQMRQTSQSLLTQSQELERQFKTAQQGHGVAETPGAAAVAAPPPSSGRDYLNVTDPSEVEGAIETYLNHNGIKATRVTGNAGAIHFVQVGFTGLEGQPNFVYRITALPPSANAGKVSLQLIGFTLETNVKASTVSEPLMSALGEANKLGNCSWFVEAGNVRCRSWLDIPGSSLTVPTQMIADKLGLMNNEWLKYSAQIVAATK